MTYKIKNMVCSRCIRSLMIELNEVNLSFNDIRLGELVVDKEYSDKELKQLDKLLDILGFSRITSAHAALIELIKHIIIRFLYETPNWAKFKLSEFIEYETNTSYKKSSLLFSQVESITIEKYFILQKIERAKELIIYNEMTFSEIAYELGYSSAQHFSNQFKQVIGLTPRQFKQSNSYHRNSIDHIY